MGLVFSHDVLGFGDVFGILPEKTSSLSSSVCPGSTVCRPLPARVVCLKDMSCFKEEAFDQIADINNEHWTLFQFLLQNNPFYTADNLLNETITATLICNDMRELSPQIMISQSVCGQLLAFLLNKLRSNQ